MQVRNSPTPITDRLTQADMYSKSTGAPAEHFIDDVLVNCVDLVAEEFGPLRITSTFRTEGSNAAAGGASKSQHKLGKACDHRPADQKKFEVYRAMIASKTGIYDRLVALGARGFGIYDNFIHIDVRERDEPVHWSDAKLDVRQIIEKALDPEMEDRKDMLIGAAQQKAKDHPLLVVALAAVLVWLFWPSND